ncbi:MAG: nicotinate-nucleotide adenylyltransferase [Gemmatimonadales bacterium]|jgi:nicotinate-nucleotide adenylyltransferase|nr:nicotinate-nucleotide adenylyltransferase [Gemmatimonadales bacterium]
MRIGVFGGTFDPPHVGHLLLAADARESLNLDRLIFIPVWTQPFKVGTPPVASPQDRLEMVRLAISDDANYAVDDAEINRKGLSYTVDTLEYLAGHYAGAELYLLVGEDALAGFRQWRNPQRILELATLALMMRSGAPDIGDWRRAEGLVRLSTRRVDVSSTEIRERRRAGKSIKGFVPESVERFIEARGLYS